MSRIPFVFLLLISILHLAACGESDREWDTSRETLQGAAEGQDVADERWSVYRDQIVEGLDLMRDALSSARALGTVADRDEIDGLVARVGSLREEMASRVDAPPRPEQLRLRTSFEDVRSDVDALLTRLGYDPDMIARWQDKT
jgi:hypothetical protein